MPEAEKIELIYSLVGFPNETEWIEFKESNSDPERIGRDISALANSAAYLGRDCAYRVWGVKDDTHELVGTTFNPYAKKAKGNQDLLIWLTRFLSQNANYEFDAFEHGGLNFVVLCVKAATGQPVSFDKAIYIREGSSTKRLESGSAKEIELWRRLQQSDFESRVAERDCLDADVEQLLDIDAYFNLLGERRPETLSSAVSVLCEQDLVRRQDNGRLSVTNLGALLVARKLSEFRGLGKRALRIVRYVGNSSLERQDDQTFDEGYALALPDAEAYIMSQSPRGELVEGAFRKIVPTYPQRAVRELLSNTVIHQDLSDSTEGPMVMMYDNRIEFSNPGVTLIPVERVLNASPKTRNVSLVRLLRQMGLCEEGGTGWDLAVAACEAAHMAAPQMRSEDGLGTRVTLFAGSAYEHMTKAERREAVYWHACLKFAEGSSMSNQSLRERFGLSDERRNTVAMSRLIRECCEANLIKEEDKEASAKYRRYVPFWY